MPFHGLIGFLSQTIAYRVKINAGGRLISSTAHRSICLARASLRANEKARPPPSEDGQVRGSRSITPHAASKIDAVQLVDKVVVKVHDGLGNPVVAFGNSLGRKRRQERGLIPTVRSMKGNAIR